MQTGYQPFPATKCRLLPDDRTPGISVDRAGMTSPQIALRIDGTWGESIVAIVKRAGDYEKTACFRKAPSW